MANQDAGVGLYRADGRTNFGCRVILNKLQDPFCVPEEAFPLAFWYVVLFTLSLTL